MRNSKTVDSHKYSQSGLPKLLLSGSIEIANTNYGYLPIEVQNYSHAFVLARFLRACMLADIDGRGSFAKENVEEL